MLSDEQVRQFRDVVWNYYHAHARSMPWRSDPSPYHVLVSELMLQQTQVGRALPKYEQFIQRFPTIQLLAEAPLADVLGVWSGLGYNRRTKFLHRTAQKVMNEYGGRLPDTLEELVTLPGIGRNTAGAVLAYAHNQPVAFIETNVRTVFFHHFFMDREDVDDKELLPLIEQTRDPENIREWYWALMDYGTHLKQTLGNNIKQSRHYAKQSKFEGSRRQVRGKILKVLVAGPSPAEELAKVIDDERFDSVVGDLLREGFIEQNGSRLRLTGGLELP
jgi:A/G-specific adenine glycosylase